MRAKFINEIKQNRDNSGLSSIGIGKSYLTKVYEKIKKEWPDLLKVSNLLSEDNDDTINTIKPLIKEYLNEKENNILCIDLYKISNNSRTPFLFSKWLKELNTPIETIEINPTNLKHIIKERIYIVKTIKLNIFKDYSIIKTTIYLNTTKDENKIGIKYLYFMIK